LQLSYSYVILNKIDSNLINSEYVYWFEILNKIRILGDFKIVCQEILSNIAIIIKYKFLLN
jgi:hypothetical protein